MPRCINLVRNFKFFSKVLYNLNKLHLLLYLKYSRQEVHLKCFRKTFQNLEIFIY